MKRRVRVQPTNPYYTDEPAVSKALIADKGLTQNASLGNQPPKGIVDKKPGRLSGLAGFVSKSKPIIKRPHISTPKINSVAKTPAPSKLRTSGHPSAHRLGATKLKV